MPNFVPVLVMRTSRLNSIQLLIMYLFICSAKPMLITCLLLFAEAERELYVPHHETHDHDAVHGLELAEAVQEHAQHLETHTRDVDLVHAAAEHEHHA
eukprot:15479993-Alexandrium_andersonii.AAC.1